MKSFSADFFPVRRDVEMLILRLLHFLLSLLQQLEQEKGTYTVQTFLKAVPPPPFKRGALEIKTARVYFAKKKWQDKHRVRDYCTEIS